MDTHHEFALKPRTFAGYMYVHSYQHRIVERCAVHGPGITHI